MKSTPARRRHLQRASLLGLERLQPTLRQSQDQQRQGGPIEIKVLERVGLRWSCKHFLAKRNPCKKSADLPLDKVIYYIGAFLGLY
jgi:hypothetical protein